ncbi:hypothetical protein diail_9928 [Diaporthe ilicicola]|nr:hypothetical protein diail_9928 [Diaporthe ilicicola]
MSQFHLFGQLPQELQDLIWDLAIRDDGPGAHFFTIYDAAKDLNSVVGPAQVVHATSATHVSAHRVGFAAPQRRGTSHLSWTHGNISDYLTDSGLWTACRDSRMRMLSRFRPAETSPQVSRRTVPADLGAVDRARRSPMATVNMQFQGEDGERRYLTIRPSSDLLCLQPAGGGSLVSEATTDQWRYITDFPVLRWPTPGGHRMGEPSRLRNIAVEFDRARGPNPWVCPLRSWVRLWLRLSHAEHVAGLENFWLIDYSLARRYKAAGDRRGRRTFRAGGGGLELVEVLRTDDEWCSSGMCFNYDSFRCLCVRHLRLRSGAHCLARALKNYQDIGATSHHRHGSDDEEHPVVQYGVLACVDPKSEKDLPTRDEWIGLNWPNELIRGSSSLVSWIQRE